MSTWTKAFLILLRLAIGWHFFIEGVEKIQSVNTGPTETNRPWSSAGYLQEASGPLGNYFRRQIGDPDLETCQQVGGGTRAEPLPHHDRQEVDGVGLGKWFHPAITIHRQGGLTPGAHVIQPGDMLHTDFGLVYLGFSTDTQHNAYVLKPGETDARDAGARLLHSDLPASVPPRAYSPSQTRSSRDPFAASAAVDACSRARALCRVSVNAPLAPDPARQHGSPLPFPIPCFEAERIAGLSLYA